jgi:thiol-disulfide isomerase/thioredoxin
MIRWAGLAALTSTLWAAEEKLATLKVGPRTYTNVIVTAQSATDLYFMHAGGVANVKLKELDPELQKQFGFDAGKAAESEKLRAEARAKGVHPMYLTPNTPAPDPRGVAQPEAADPANKISAKSFLNQPAPAIAFEKWIKEAPSREGKFLLVDFWATWCGPCRASIPHLNELHKKYGDRLIVLGLSDEPEATVRKLTTPKMEYYSAIDTKGRTAAAAQVRGIPHGILIDPQGIVRWEGHPAGLTDANLQRLLAKYAH